MNVFQIIHDARERLDEDDCIPAFDEQSHLVFRQRLKAAPVQM